MFFKVIFSGGVSIVSESISVERENYSPVQSPRYMSIPLEYVDNLIEKIILRGKQRIVVADIMGADLKQSRQLV